MGVYKKGKSWYINFYYQGQRIQECVGQASKTVAKEVLAKRKAEVIEGRYDLNKVKLTPLFEVFCDQYLETFSKQNKRPKSYQRDITSSKHLKAYFGGKRLADITTWQIEKYKAMRKAEVSPASVNREISCLRHMLNMAVKWGKLKDNPFKGIKLFREDNERMWILSLEEEGRLLEAIRRCTKRGEHLEPMVITALNTGMRRGEIFKLKKSDIDFRNGFILVEHTKNGESRKIPMNERLTETLKKVTNKDDSLYVFASKEGLPYKDIKNGWWAVTKKAGVDGLRFHDLRHTFATRLIMGGADIVTIAELLGHK